MSIAGVIGCAAMPLQRLSILQPERCRASITGSADCGLTGSSPASTLSGGSCLPRRCSRGCRTATTTNVLPAGRAHRDRASRRRPRLQHKALRLPAGRRGYRRRRQSIQKRERSPRSICRNEETRPGRLSIARTDEKELPSS